jgi:flavin reductase (DIM6/NTAB) family NADH-FMN oxidoreductase RutF
VAIAVRKANYTYGNLMEKGAFTVNIPSQDQVEEADYFGIVSGRNEDKIARVGMTAVRSELVDAPYLKECPMVLECQMLHAYEIGLHTQFIGEIKDVKMEESLLDASGASSIENVRPFLYAPDDRSYYSIGAKLAKGFEVGYRVRGNQK